MKRQPTEEVEKERMPVRALRHFFQGIPWSRRSREWKKNECPSGH